MPQIPQPPANMIAPYGSTAPFNPQWTSFLPANPNQVATGLTPQMLAGIQQGPSFAPPPPAAGMGMPGDLDQMRAQLAKLMAARGPHPMSRQGIFQRATGGRLGGSSIGGGGGSNRGGYSTSGRGGAGGFGSRSSSASRAGGGLY